ncbi:MAG: hypothetical protein HY586_01570 [Candidatus Omnitrophica bacterium]|nr:hypothetical protein [Candidatus Omnitrophota bacterium]
MGVGLAGGHTLTPALRVRPSPSAVLSAPASAGPPVAEGRGAAATLLHPGCSGILVLLL